VRRVFGPRFAVEAAALAGVAFLAWYERLSRLAVVGVMAGTWVVMALVEWRIGRRAEPVEDEQLEAQAEPEVGPEPERPPELELAQDGAEAAELEPAPEPVAAPAIWTGPPREWNVFDLERLAREGAGVDAGRDEEREFLLLYLRDFAGPDGRLPANFDGLVRDSFGELLAGSRL
jgi:hypothetical protein